MKRKKSQNNNKHVRNNTSDHDNEGFDSQDVVSLAIPMHRAIKKHLQS